MKFNTLPPLKVLALTLLSIFHFSCSKDSDLLADYVISDTSVSKGIANLVVDDTYQVSLTGSIVLDVLANDTFENETEVVITETSTPTNGTVIINNDNETLTYTPAPEIIAQVSDTSNTAVGEVVDTFTYTAEVVSGEGAASSEVASVVITAADNTARQNAVVNISPWDYCQDGNPIGGGAGYDAIVTSGDITITTSDNYSTLRTKIESASSGQIVFINSNVSMDLTNLGSTSIKVPAGVTIASDRGNNGSEGALLYSNQMKYDNSGSERPIFLVWGENVRITGFTMRGPFGFSGDYSPTAESGRRLKFCIVSNFNNTEVDNMHGYNWPASFISFGRFASIWGPSIPTTGGKIHHNYIHNNLQNGMGYAADVQQTSESKVYANMFHSNRHDVTSRGKPDNSYEAYCNTTISEFPANTGFALNGPVGTKVYNITSDGSGNTISQNPLQAGNTHHNYDVHPEYYCNNDNLNYALCDPPAGARYYIHHNDFQDDGVARHGKVTGNMTNVGIGGVPSEYMRVEYNRTLRPYLKNWDVNGNYIDKTGPYKDWFFTQGRCETPLPKGNIILVGNVIN